MAEEKTLLEWSGKQPDWVQDALRRHAATASSVLSPEDKQAILDRVRAAASKADVQPECIPLAADHLKPPASEKRTIFCSIGPVANLNRLAADQKLSFATDGITLIYGDNGSGKSGYCRIAKKVCRSPTADPLLGNVFEVGTKAPAEALLRFVPPGENDVVSLDWKDGDPAPEPLANLSVFDSKNARLYIDEKNRFGFLPADIALLERHAAHRREMDKLFDTELKDINGRLKTPLPSGFTAGGTVSVTLAKLSGSDPASWPTAAALTALAAFTGDDAKELKDLEKRLASDPLEAASRRRRSASQLKAYDTRIAAMSEALSTRKAEALEVALDAFETATNAAALAADTQFAGEPLKGVGSDPWKMLYRAAEKYAISIGGDALATGESDACVLCQQPLGPDGSARLKRFAQFMVGETTKAAQTAERAVKALAAEIDAVMLPAKSQAQLDLAEFSSLDATHSELAKAIADYCDKAARRKEDLKRRATGYPKQAIEALDGTTLLAAIKSDIATLEDEAAALEDKGKQDSTRVYDVARLDALKDAEKLKDNLPTFLARVEDLVSRSKIEECKKQVGTGPLSSRITSLRRIAVAGGLEDRIKKEIENLDLGHIPFVVADMSENGQSYFEVGLEAAVEAKNADILSEGEQRALALACFLAEIGEEAAGHGIVVDDPVSSLDHLRIRRVAERLVAEARNGRQVIIFTHNLLFYNEVADAAARSSPQVPIAKRNVTKSLENGFGLITEEDEPWTAQKVSERVTRLKARAAELAKVKDFDTDDYRRAAKDFYSDLRETWERLIEEILLFSTVERFSSDVKTMRLKGVVVEDEDYKTVFWAMKRVSERSGHDMAAGKNIPVPTPDEMKKDAEELDTYRTAIKKRASQTSTAREALEKPPAAKTL